MSGYRKEDAYKVLHLLEEYRDSLQPTVSTQDVALRLSLDNLIAAIRARLFTALSDLLQFYNSYLLDATRSSEEKTKFSSSLALHWQQCTLPHVSSSIVKYPEKSSRYYDYTLSVKRVDRDLGISVVGDDESEIREGNSGIFISYISEDSPAAEYEELRMGDRVLEVNGLSFFSIHPSQADNMLRSLRGSIDIILRRYISRGVSVCEVALSKTNSSFGFTIKGGIDNQYVKGNDGVFLSKLFIGGAAEKTGQLSPGDRIIEVNGVSIEHVRHEDAVKLLSSSGDQILIKVEKRGMPEESEEESLTFREVVLERGENGYGMNIIGKDTPSLAVYVSQVTLGGPADVSGKIFKGDRILEVNEQDVRHVTYEVVASLFRSSQHRVKIKVRQSTEGWEEVMNVGNGTSEANNSLGVNTYQDTFYLRTWFSFDPNLEPDIPDTGLSFSYNNILCVVNSTNTDWWQAFSVDELGKVGACGLIPSEKYLLKREQMKNRSVHFPDQDSSDVDGIDPGRTNKKFLKKFRKNSSKRPKQSTHSEGVDSSTGPALFYTHVDKLEKEERRPIILLGPLKDHLNDMLVQEFSGSYAGCVPHTTRPIREGEQHGVDYYFVSVEEMERLISQDSFIEAGRYNQNLYGTTAKAVKDVLEARRHCILSVSTQSIPRLEQAGLSPIIVLVYPTSPNVLIELLDNGDSRPLEPDEYLRQVEVAEQINADVGNKISGIAKGDNIRELFYSVTTVINTHSYTVDWIPINMESNKH